MRRHCVFVGYWFREGLGKLKYLVGDVWSRIANVASHLAHDTDVFVAVEQRVLVIAARARTRGCTVRLETGIREHDNQPLGVLVGVWDWGVLLRYQLWQLGRW